MHDQKVKTKTYISWDRRAFEIKFEAFFIIFKGVSVAKNCLRPESVPLMSTFFKCQFNYFPLICMWCSRSLNNKIDRLHERFLRIVYSDKTSDFRKLLVKDSSVSVHYQNILQLATEMFKVLKGLYFEILKRLFQFRNYIPYNFSGTESIKFFCPKIWELISDEMIELESIWEFKKAMKLW